MASCACMGVVLFKVPVKPAIPLSSKPCFSGMRLLRNTVLGLAIAAMLVVLAEPAQAQAYKEAFNAARDAASAGDFAAARTSFLDARVGAREANDSETLRKASYAVAQINNRLGNAALKAENYERALDLFNEGTELYPDYIRNSYGAGLALKRLGRMEDALAAWKSAAEGQGDRRTSLVAESAIRDHFIYQASSAVSRSDAVSRDADRAMTALEQLLLYVEPDANYHYYRAVALHIKGQFSDAVAAADEALAVHNGSRADKAKIFFTKGEALIGAGDRDAAKEAFQNAAFGSYKASAEHYLSTL